MGVYDNLGLTPIINASGSVTRLGGAPMSGAVLDAFRDAAHQWVPLDMLQASASRFIASVTGAEAGLVTAGSAGAPTLGAAAIMARYDLSKMERLPQCEGFPHEFIVAREHRSGYDHAVRAAGAKLVEVGFHEVIAGAGVRRAEAWEYEAAISLRTAGILYVYGPQSQPPLEEVVAVARRNEVPVLVDAAGELPPRSNLLLPSVTGADLVAFSGGKAIGGPQSTGVLCGERHLIASAALQMLDMDDHWELWEPPTEFIDKSKLAGMPRHGIGRALKVLKEEIVALITALAIFASEDRSKEIQWHRENLRAIADILKDARASCEIMEFDDGERLPLLEITIDGDLDQTAWEICRNLRHVSPPIYVGHGKLREGKLIINPMCLDRSDCDTVGRAIRTELTG